MAENLLSKTG